MKWSPAFVLIMFKSISCKSGTIECGQDVRVNVTTQPQNLTSPLFPNSYPRPVSCKWNLKAVENSRLHFRVDTFSLAPSTFCYLDNFKIKDGGHRLSPQIFSWCGYKKKGVEFKTSGHVAVIFFSATKDGTKANGFRIEFWSQKKEIPLEAQAKLTTVNYVMISLFGLTIAAFLVTATCLVARKYSLQKRNKIFCSHQPR